MNNIEVWSSGRVSLREFQFFLNILLIFLYS